MKCPQCETVNEEDSTFCSNCGALLEEKPKKKGKFVIVIAVVAVLVVASFSYVTLFSYEIDRANELVDMANQEIACGNSVLNNTVSPKLSEFREASIDVDTDNEINSEINRVSGWSQDAEGMRTEVGKVSDYFKRAKRYFEETKVLRLPDWYHEYIDLKIKALEKDLERMGKLQELLDNYAVYYGFCREYLRGKLKMADAWEDFTEGSDKLDGQDFSTVTDAFEDALEKLKDSEEDFAAAEALIDLDYMGELEDYLEDLSAVVEDLVDASQLLDSGLFSQANQLLQGTSVTLEPMEKFSDDMIVQQLGVWYEMNVEDLIEEVGDLMEEVQELEEKAKDLYQENM